MKKRVVLGMFGRETSSAYGRVRAPFGGGMGGGADLDISWDDQEFGKEQEQRIVPRRYIIIPPDPKITGSQEWGVFDNLKREVVETYPSEFMVKEKVNYLNQKDMRSYGFKKDLVRFAFVSAAALSPFLIKSLWDIWMKKREMADSDETRKKELALEIERDKRKADLELETEKKKLDYKMQKERELREENRRR